MVNLKSEVIFFNSFFLSLELIDVKYMSFIFLMNLISYVYILVKFYKVLCYSKLTFEWMPIINPYVWPFSAFQVVTTPYFGLWARVLPIIKLDKSSVEISSIIALEALNAVLYFCVRSFNHLLLIIQQIESLR